MIVSVSGFPQVDMNFALGAYRKRFREYADIELSEKILDLQEFPFRITAFGKQYLADALLQAGLRINGGNVVVVLTSADIYTGGMNYVFGLATNGSALISSARIDPGFWKDVKEIFHYSSEGRLFFEKQYEKVLIHKLGHAFGLSHCNNVDCAMHYSNSPAELYQKGEWYCEDCRKRFLSITQQINV